MEGRSAITINASPDEVYARFRQLERLPEFMYHVTSVQVTGEGRSHWVAKGPAGTTVEWDAEVVEEVPGQRIAWRSVPDSSVESSGSVEFRRAPAEQGTEVRVVLDYQPPGGALGLGKVVAALFGEEPNQQLADDLRRLKQLIETGEIARSEGSPAGTRTMNQADQSDAHPQEVQT
jgi:uncharacterized membrane protein